jgi:hypothetical protein
MMKASPGSPGSCRSHDFELGSCNARSEKTSYFPSKTGWTALDALFFPRAKRSGNLSPSFKPGTAKCFPFEVASPVAAADLEFRLKRSGRLSPSFKPGVVKRFAFEASFTAGAAGLAFRLKRSGKLSPSFKPGMVKRLAFEASSVEVLEQRGKLSPPFMPGVA